MDKTIKCLFCKQSTLGSKSVEHIIPEALGSKKRILPVGIVCDKCNQYFAVKVEKPLLEHPSFRNIRAYNMIPGKKGKMPSMLGLLGNIPVGLSVKKGVGISVAPENANDRAVFDKLFTNRLATDNFEPVFFPKDPPPPKELMSKFLAKMALEAVAYLNAADAKWIHYLVNSQHHDLVRNFARYGTSVKDWPYLERRIFPEETQMRHPDTNEWVQVGFGHDIFVTDLPETYFLFHLYGIEYAFNVGGPSVKGYEKWLEKNKVISPLFQKMGVTLTTRKTPKGEEYFLE